MYQQVLNTKDYGIPQYRRRVFFVGIKTTLVQLGEFKFPSTKKIRHLKLSFMLDNTDQTRFNHRVKHKITHPNDAVFINMNQVHRNSFPNSGKYSPTLLAKGTLWCVPYHRYTNVKEHLRLQGFPVKFKQVVSNTTMKIQLGNSISVNVMKHLLNICLPYLGI